MPRLLPPGLHGLDAVEPGDHLQTDWAEITPARVDTFAALTGDRFEAHMTDAGAARHGFPGRIAHGLLILSVVEGLKASAAAQFATYAALGWDWQFRMPVPVGDSIRATVTVQGKRVATATTGLLTLEVTVENRQGAPVQRGTARLMGYRQVHFTR